MRRSTFVSSSTPRPCPWRRWPRHPAPPSHLSPPLKTPSATPALSSTASPMSSNPSLRYFGFLTAWSPHTRSLPHPHSISPSPILLVALTAPASASPSPHRPPRLQV